jgi:hypothetical protein
MLRVHDSVGIVTRLLPVMNRGHKPEMKVEIEVTAERRAT